MFCRSRLYFSAFIVLLGPVCSLFPALTIAQSPPQTERPRRVMPAESEPQDVIKIDSDLVPIDVVATDEKGRLVRNLTKDDFKFYEDGAERPIASSNIETIAGRPSPLRVVLLFT